MQYSFFTKHREVVVWSALFSALGFLLLGAMAFVIAPQSAQALSCIVPKTAPEELQSHEYVFYGVVTDVEIDEGDEGVGGDERGTITITVEEWFKGNLGKDVELELGSYSTWYSKPEVGQKTVIYVSEYEGEEGLSMPLCGRSTIGDGAAREVALLRGEEPPKEEPTEEIVGCHTLVYGSPLMPGLGAPYNTQTKELILSATCSSEEGVTLEATTEGIIYKHGFVLVGNSWKTFTFEGESVDDEWLSGAASYTLPSAWTVPGETFHFISLTCQEVDGAWKCGCPDASCSKPSWQLQSVQVPEFEVQTPFDGNGEMIACTMDAMQCPDGSWVGRTGPSCEFICPAE